MRTIKYIRTISLSLSMLLVLLMINQTVAQKKEKTRVRAYYQKLDNNDLQLMALLTSGSGKNMMNIAGAEIKVYNLADDEAMLASIETNVDGEAILRIENGYPLKRNAEGYAELSFVFAGNDTLRGSDRDLEFKDVILKPNFEIVDSVKVIKIMAFEDSAGVSLPVPELKIKIGVQRMLSILNLATVETDDQGLAKLEFPNDLPGDSLGNLKIIIKVDDDRDYGTVLSKNNVKWGTIVDYSINNDERSLFGDEAPMWMLFAVLIVLGGAWYHFIWAIIKVWGIKKQDSPETI